MTIKFTVANISDIQLSELRQVNGTKTLYKGMISGGTISDSTVTGGEITEMPLVDADKGNFIKQYSVTVEYLNATKQQKAAVIGKTLTLSVKLMDLQN